MKRVVFYEITEGAVKEAVKNPRAISMELVNAQQARRALDYLVGFNLSPLLWKKIRRGLSAGRVQSPALRLIVERELEIENFKTQEYWTIHFDSEKDKHRLHGAAHPLQGREARPVRDRQRASARPRSASFLEAARQGHGESRQRSRRRASLRSPAAPFTTSTLQQEAVRKLGFSTDRAMKVAQSLYEGVDVGKVVTGLITYMRTDSVTLSKEARRRDARLHHEELRQPSTCPKAPGRSTAATPRTRRRRTRPSGRRPSRARPDSVAPYLNDEQRKLYEMIWKRAIASQMTPAQFDTVAVDFTRGRRGQHSSAPPARPWSSPASTPSTTRTRTTPIEEEDKRLPPLEKGDVVKIEKLYGEQHFTQPPPRYSEASLVKTLEQYGIGRPSTYASIISTLENREYVTLDKKRFKPTDVGPRGEQVPHRALRPLGRLRIHRQARGRARRHLQRQGRVGADAGESSGRTSPRRSRRRNRSRART